MPVAEAVEKDEALGAKPAGRVRPPKARTEPAPAWKTVVREARERFGIKGFRPGQREILEAVFAGKDVLGLMPTGGGKSLTYQLPAVFFDKPVLVVSPLIALMQDQQERAAEAEIEVQKVDSTLSLRAAEEASETIAEGAARLIYVTPERMESAEFLQSLIDGGGVSLMVVDEAHTIAQWGHDFRPAYLGLGYAREQLGRPPVLALTATATKEVCDEILEVLHARDAVVVNTGSERTNLHLAVHPTVNLDAKLARIGALLEKEDGTGIIYTASTKSADDVCTWLTEHGIAAGRYHGKMKTRDREEAQAGFMRGEHKVMIATKAFGLGIDKADIRFVYHFEFPDSLETYAQEAGRAGRDGLPCRAVLLYRLEDKRIQTYFLAGRYPQPHEMEAVFEALSLGLKLPAVEAREAAEANENATAAKAPGDVVFVAKEAGASEAVVPAKPKGMTLSARVVAEYSGVAGKRTQVILHLLEEAGLVRRGRNGYRLVKGVSIGAEKALELLTAYEERAAHDRERLCEMMHYAETPDCRTQVLRRHFGEAEGERCGRCDNCERGVDPEQDLPVAAEADAKARRGRKSKVAAAQHAEKLAERHADDVQSVKAAAAVEAESRPHAAVWGMQTESVPERFVVGDRVRHARFGLGQVRDVHGDHVLVKFPKEGEKRLLAAFLEGVR